jgi:hypothetical protein
MSVILDALKTLLYAKQKDAKSLQDYTKRFKIVKKNLKSHIDRPIIIAKIPLTIYEYNKFPTDEMD